MDKKEFGLIFCRKCGLCNEPKPTNCQEVDAAYEAQTGAPMSKRGKRYQKKKKNKKVKRNYNKKEFTEVFCQTCLICDHLSPGFCYNNLYKHEPRPFINKVFNNLIDVHAAYQAMGRSIKSMSVEQFQNVFCRTGICFKGDVFASAACDSVKDCYQEFMQQQGVNNSAMIHEADASNLIDFKNNKTNKRYISYSKRNKKKGSGRYVCTPYATFFSRDDADFQAEIRKILYGDNNGQQDKDQELPPSSTGAADRHTEGGQPKVSRSSSEGPVDGEP